MAEINKASTIYERMQMEQEENSSGSVNDDIADMDMDEMEEYFGDTDPTEFL